MAKLHDINAQMVENQGFLDYLWDLMENSKPIMVANVVHYLKLLNLTQTATYSI